MEKQPEKTEEGLGVHYIQLTPAPPGDTALSEKILMESASEKDRISEVTGCKTAAVQDVMNVWYFIPWNLLLSPFHHLDDLNNVERDINIVFTPEIQIVMLFFFFFFFKKKLGEKTGTPSLKLFN